ncbi:MAG: thioesterase family protein [Myxococcota bacterium]
MLQRDLLFDEYRDVVRPEWIDYNGHLNVGYYALVFDYSTDAFLDALGLDAPGRERMCVTTFTLESHFTYQREVIEGEQLEFTTQLLGFDQKRIHYFHTMIRESGGEISATNELMSLHVSTETRRTAPFHPEVRDRLQEFMDRHSALPRPPEVGQVIGLSGKRKKVVEEN